MIIYIFLKILDFYRRQVQSKSNFSVINKLKSTIRNPFVDWACNYNLHSTHYISSGFFCIMRIPWWCIVSLKICTWQNPCVVIFPPVRKNTAMKQILNMVYMSIFNATVHFASICSWRTFHFYLVGIKKVLRINWPWQFVRYLGNAGVHKSSNNLVITVIVALRDILGALKIK